MGCYIGDMPHTWVGSGLINSVRGLLLYEKNDTLILGAGIDSKWLEEGRSISIGNFPTHFGSVNYEMEKNGDTVEVKLSGNAAPPDGFVVKSPIDKEMINVTLNGEALTALSRDEVVVDRLPARLVITYGDDRRDL